ncbi:UNVERIFIED_ORG: hypothetical protein M2438_004096 [Methylobacterium sp. SuP10 SLI 274]|nr:hypothetical protein [Methylobacterium sp. SuP10 SLI 274]
MRGRSSLRAASRSTQASSVSSASGPTIPGPLGDHRFAIDGEEAGIEAAGALRRRDRPRHQMQGFEIGHHPFVGEGLPRTLRCGLRRTIIAGADEKAGLLVGLADRGERERAAEMVGCARQLGPQGVVGPLRQGTGDRHHPVGRFDPSAGKHELAAHEGEAGMAPAHQQLQLLP